MVPRTCTRWAPRDAGPATNEARSTRELSPSPAPAAVSAQLSRPVRAETSLASTKRVRRSVVADRVSVKVGAVLILSFGSLLLVFFGTPQMVRFKCRSVNRSTNHEQPNPTAE